MGLDKLLALAEDAAKKANAAIMQNYDKFDIFVKADRSPLTNADLAANDVIMRTLEPSGIAICSEECVLDSKRRMNKERFWLIDPLDGTKEFIARNGEFCVCIALIERGRPILSAIGVPVSGDIYSSNGGGVYKNGALLARPASAPQIFMHGRHSKSEKYPQFAQKFKMQLVRKGSAIKFCILAEGGASAYARFSDCSLWDIAAGDFLLHQSGGAVIDLKTMKAPLYNGKSLINNHYLAVCANTIKFLPEMLEFAKNF